MLYLSSNKIFVSETEKMKFFCFELLSVVVRVNRQINKLGVGNDAFKMTVKLHSSPCERKYKKIEETKRAGERRK